MVATTVCPRCGETIDHGKGLGCLACGYHPWANAPAAEPGASTWQPDRAVSGTGRRASRPITDQQVMMLLGLVIAVAVVAIAVLLYSRA